MSPAMAAAAAVTGRLTDVRDAAGAAGAEPWKPFARLDAVAAPLARRQRRHRPDHPGALPAEAALGDFGDFLFHDLRFDATGRAAPDFVAQRPGLRAARGSSSPGATSAAARRASTRSGRCTTTASARSIAPSFGDIFCTNALKNGLLPVVLPEAVVDSAARRTLRPRPARRVGGRPRGADGDPARRRRAPFAIEPSPGTACSRASTNSTTR